jgi:alpha-beta hydrolase superfamily lysophospholipase
MVPSPAVVPNQPAASRRLALGLALLAAVGIALPAAVRLVTAVPGGTDVRLGPSSAAQVPASWPGLAVQDIAVERGSGLPSGTVRVGIAAPATAARADLLFFHGHSDRMDNHRALFTAWRDGAVRVISFDLPEHGGTAAGSLDTWDLDELVVLASRIEERTREDRGRPLFLGGFSAGGELAYHAAVHPELLARFGRRPAGLALLSPALAVQPVTAGDGISKPRALARPGGAALAPPSPAVPLANPLFAAGLLLQGWQDRELSPPRDLPVFVATGDAAQDTYIDVGKIRQWVVRLAGDDVRVDAIACPGARHAIDNEAWPVDGDVVAAARGYIDGVLSGRPRPVPLAVCRPYEHAYLDAGATR